jgi:D-glycero-alpha-D-manno-heptose 1-phosphate guanylyltransferase
MKLLILAGGFGTRLQDKIDGLPKALAPIGREPFLSLLYHKADLIVDFLKSHKDGILKDCQVDWLIEPKPMDTGGAIAHAVYKLDLRSNFLVTNADTWVSGGFLELMSSSPPTIAVVENSDSSRFGQVLFDNRNQILSFKEKNISGETCWINAGLYHLSSNLFEGRYTETFSLESDLFIKLVQEKTLMAFKLNVDIVDIGVPNDYFRFCLWAKKMNLI